MSELQHEPIPELARKVDLDTIRSLLVGAHFPADRQQVVDYARSRYASADILALLDAIPRQYYQSEADVRRAIAKLGLEEQQTSGEQRRKAAG